MTREAFIRKWLGNPQKQYNEECRNEMRDDLDLVIEAALRQPLVIGSVCPDCLMGRDEFDPDWKCPNCRGQTDL